MENSVATMVLAGVGPLSQSRQHNEPKLEGESHDDYDDRTWRSKLNVSRATGHVVIPAHGFHQALTAAAKYDGGQIKGQGKKTWTAKLERGVCLFDDVQVNHVPEEAEMIAISANADGVRGSGKRVLRRFPIFHEWEATAEVFILDPIVVESEFMRIVALAGRFIGVGRFRPEKGGQNGRFRIKSMKWDDKREMVF